MGKLEVDLALGRELIETHVSWVFLEPDNVYKLKKPKDLGFLNFSTSELRRVACENEVRLNQRLSHGVYLGVVPVTRGPDGIHRIAGDGQTNGLQTVDHAVAMRRLNDAERADVRLERGELSRTDVRRIAEQLARFHEDADTSSEITHYGSAESIRHNVEENFEQAREFAATYVSTEQEQEIEAAQLGFLEQRRATFEERQRRGRIRDGHGDLRLEHVYLSPEGTNIIDCIEFNERFRYADVCADLAFLSMDLRHAHRTDLAEDLLAAYAQVSGDFDLYALVDFYESYRAYVRAKVSSFLASDADASFAARSWAEKNARSYYLQALLSQRAPQQPAQVVAVGGLIASGKSITSERLSARLNAAVVATDPTRKHLLGKPAEAKLPDAAFSGAYDPSLTGDVYDEVLRRAGVVVASGRSVILDASFRSRRDRERARELARSHGAAFRFVECRVDRDTTERRLDARAQGPSVSDGRREIYDDFAARWEETSELHREEHLLLDTTANDARIEASLESFLK